MQQPVVVENTPVESSLAGVFFVPSFPSAARSLIILPSQPEKTGMNAADLAARARRLDQFSRALALEISTVIAVPRGSSTG